MQTLIMDLRHHMVLLMIHMCAIRNYIKHKAAKHTFKDTEAQTNVLFSNICNTVI